MNRINLKELNAQKDFLNSQIKNNEALASLYVRNNQDFIDLEKKVKEIKDQDYTLIFYSHTFAFAFYYHDVADNTITHFYIDVDGELEINTNNKEIVEFAHYAHKIITKEFY